MFPSIRSFLAFTYTLVVVLIIAVLGVGIQLLVETRLRANVETDLKLHGDQLAAVIVDDVDTDVTAQVNRLVEGLNFGSSGGDVTYVRLYDSTGLPLPVAGPQSPIPDANPRQLLRLRGQPIRVEQATDGSELLVLTRRVNYEGHTLAFLQVARDLGPVTRVTSQLRRTLIAGTILAAAAAAVLSYVLAYQALRPFSTIVDDAARIGPEDIHRRLPPQYGVAEVDKLAQSFNALLDRLQKAFDLQRRFVADASHELRTPLTTIRGNVDVMLLDPELSPSVRQSLQHVSSESARLSRLVTNLLMLARVEAGQSGPQFAPVDLHALVLETVAQARAMSDKVDIRLGQEDQATVPGDADQLRQVLHNLIDNAVKYTPAGGHVRVSVYREGTWAKLEVSDTGVGISPQDIEHIFDRFYRSERTRHGAAGSGLGLSIVNWVVRAHGGRVTVESRLGRGTTFTVWIPLLAPVPAALLSNPGLTLD